MAKILIVHVDHRMMYFMNAYGDILRYKNYEVIDVPIFSSKPNICLSSNRSNLECLSDLLTGIPVEPNFDLVIVFDEYDKILNEIKSMIPTKIPVFYVDIYDETEPLEGFTWFGFGVLPTEILSEVDKVLNK